VANKRIPACFVIARSLFELGAHAYYVDKHVAQHLGSSDLGQAWKFLFEVSAGSRHMRAYGLKDIGREDIAETFPVSPHISKAIAAFDEYGGLKMSREGYSFLSGFAHPSMVAFEGYTEIDKRTGSYLFPQPPPILKGDPQLESVLISAVSVSQFCNSLLAQSGETTIAAELRTLLTDFLAREGPVTE
jgi:hypothetical protein